MEKFEKLTAVAAPMPASNIDTDIIMPKAFLKRIDKEGVLEGLFHDTRLYEDGTEREELIKLCQEKGLDNIKFPGKVEPGFLSQVRTSAAALRENTQYGG